MYTIEPVGTSGGFYVKASDGKYIQVFRPLNDLTGPDRYRLVSSTTKGNGPATSFSPKEYANSICDQFNKGTITIED